MSEEINNTEEIKAEEIMVEEVKEEAKIEEAKESTPEIDLSEVKIRHIMAMRLKKYGAKRVISYILVAVLFFCLGTWTDRLLMGRRWNRGFYGKPGVQRGVPGKPFENGKGGKFNNGQQPPSNTTPPQNQTQPADGQKQ